MQCDVDRDIIGTVTSQPVNLVNDAVRHVIGFDVFDHPNQLGTVGLPGGFTGVDELLDSDRAEVASLAHIRFALRRNGEAFVSTSTFGLLFRRDAQV